MLSLKSVQIYLARTNSYDSKIFFAVFQDNQWCFDEGIEGVNYICLVFQS